MRQIDVAAERHESYRNLVFTRADDFNTQYRACQRSLRQQ
jgi:hypothetical protein